MDNETMIEIEEGFHWFVQPGAYRWGAGAVFGDEAEYPGEVPPALGVGYYPAPKAGRLRRYAPLVERTGLFRVFGETAPTEQGALGFADRFGLLLSARTYQKPLGRTRGPAAGEAVVEALAPHAERLKLWREEILTMRHAIVVWQRLEAGEHAELGRHLRWERDAAGLRAVLFDTHPGLAVGAGPPTPDLRIREAIADRDEGADWLARFRPGEPALPAAAWLGRLINRRVGGKLTAGFALDASGRLSLAIRPENLLQAMWLQFGLAVCQHKDYRRCAVCQDWFELSPEVARTNRRFCSVSCKNRSYRGRQERARRLHAEGKSARAIAEELDATVTVIKRWIAPRTSE
jgi:hypothetical protein